MTRTVHGDYLFTAAGVELVVSVAEGLRISRFGFVGGANLLAAAGGLATPTPLGPWRPLGGHRLWVAPESMPGSYAPDMLPIRCEPGTEESAVFVQPVDGAGIGKSLTVSLSDAGAVVITHRIVNRVCWPIQAAPWAISIVSSRASAFIPQPPFRSHAEDFLPARALVLWPYTSLTDPRWTIGPRLIRLTPDPGRAEAQKIGAGNAAGWCAVHLDADVFIKQFAWRPEAEYPDLGCNNELFTAGDYLEVETLGPLVWLEPGAAATHVERWSLHRAAPPAAQEDEQRDLLDRLLASAAAGLPA